ncbi:MAG: L,D-transpeptidase, partial [Actinomycetes bacterium]
MTSRLPGAAAGLAAAFILGSVTAAPAAWAANQGPAPTGDIPTSAKALTDDAVVAKLRGWGLPTGATSAMGAENLRAVCVWRELNGKLATRAALTATERESIAASPDAVVFSVPPALRAVPLMTNSTCQTAIYQSKGTVVRVIPISTGKFKGGTRKNGMFRVFAKSPGWQRSPSFPDKFGRPNIYNGIYFFGPLAIHG